jgi:hypothetical protein
MGRTRLFVGGHTRRDEHGCYPRGLESSAVTLKKESKKKSISAILAEAKEPPPLFKSYFFRNFFFSFLSIHGTTLSCSALYRAARWNRAHAYPAYCCISSCLNLSKLLPLPFGSRIYTLTWDYPNSFFFAYSFYPQSTGSQVLSPFLPLLLPFPRYLTNKLPHC